MTSPEFPENFVSLHAHEETNRAKSIEGIRADADLSVHFDALERSMNLIEYFARSWETEDIDDQALQLLGVRLFNSASASIRLLLAGYHQAAASLVRDVLETSFLVDLLANDRKQVKAWRTASDDDLKKKFSPIRVRMALDTRDSYTTKRRAKRYELLSTLASHPTPKGFRLLRPGPNQLALIGPFFNIDNLRGVGSELAMVVIEAAGNFRRHFNPRTKVLADYEVLLHHLEGTGKWMERFFNHPYDPRPAAEIAGHIAHAKKLLNARATSKK